MCSLTGLAGIGKQAVNTTISAGMFLPKLGTSATKVSGKYAVRVSTFLLDDVKCLLTDGALIKVRLTGLRPGAIR